MEEREANLAWERRFGPWAGGAAFGAILLWIVSQVVSSAANGSPDHQRDQLIKFHEHSSEALLGTILHSLSIFLIAAVALYLLRCVRHRRPEGIPSVVEPLLIASPFLITFADIATQIDVTDIADRFAGLARDAQTEKAADDLLRDRSTLPIFVSIAGHIGLGFGMVLANLNAMRVGLLTRFMSIIGIAVGALNALPLFPGVEIIQIFWLGAVGSIFLGRWPGGRGETWDTGEPGIWLSAAEQRRQAMKAEQLEAEPGPGRDDEEPEDLDARPQPASKKKRRKRRQ